MKRSNPLVVLLLLALLGAAVTIMGSMTGKLQGMIQSVGWWPKT